MNYVRRLCFGCCALVASCTGTVSGPTPGGGNDPLGQGGRTGGANGNAPTIGDGDGPMLAVPRGGARRLSRAELDASLQVLLGRASTGARQGIAEENMNKAFAFDNNYEINREASQSYVESLETVLDTAVKAAVADTKARAALVPCQPQSADDDKCMRSFVKAFGQLALRRPLDDAEITFFAGFRRFGMQSGDFYVGVEAAARAILLSPEFTYRLEVGEPVAGKPGLFKLSPYELASRLAFTLVGATPDKWLLDAAAAGQLDKPDGVKDAATKLLGDPRAKQRVHDYHSAWLGYRGALPGALANAMLEETHTLIDDVVFGSERNYERLFLSSRTFIGDDLRGVYADVGAPKTGKAGWVEYGNAKRAGILSHAAVLTAWKTGDDTSPTKRGWFVRSRLLCDEVAEPPPNVVVDVSVAQTQCKTGLDGFYVKSHQGASCRGCHEKMDPIGFGLEAYDVNGGKRTADLGKPQCKIDERGYLTLPSDTGDDTRVTFSGPGELGRAIVESGRLAACVARHVYRFAVGRMEDENEEANVAALATTLKTSGNDFAALLVQAVSHPAFGFRTEAKEVSP